MMLAALFPEEWREFGFGEGRERTTKKGSVDPFIRFYSDEDRRLIRARWFYQGEYVGLRQWNSARTGFSQELGVTARTAMSWQPVNAA